jgi:hypothetical protein
VWRGRPHVNRCAVSAAVVKPTVPVTSGMLPRPSGRRRSRSGKRRFRCAGFSTSTRRAGMMARSTSDAAASGGNPFRIGVDGDGAAVIAKYARWLRDQRHLLRAFDELQGKDLFCAPKPCHGICCCGSPTTREERVPWWRSAAWSPPTYPGFVHRQGGRVEIRSTAAAAGDAV